MREAEESVAKVKLVSTYHPNNYDP